MAAAAIWLSRQPGFQLPALWSLVVLAMALQTLVSLWLGRGELSATSMAHAEISLNVAPDIESLAIDASNVISKNQRSVTFERAPDGACVRRTLLCQYIWAFATS
jgi:hypothetical protein